VKGQDSIRSCVLCQTHRPLSADPESWPYHTDFCSFSCAGYVKVLKKMTVPIRYCGRHGVYHLGDVCPACVRRKNPGIYDPNTSRYDRRGV